MILTCEECETRYLVPGHAIGREGRKVRCTNCGHQWFVAPEEDDALEEPEDIEPIPESVRPMPEGSELPALRVAAANDAEAPALWPGYMAAGLVLVATLILVLALHRPLVKFWPASMAFYDLFGMESPVEGESLLFEDLRASVQLQEDGAPVLKVSGAILNLGRDESALPPIQVSLIAADNAILDRWLVSMQSSTVEGNGALPFQTSYPHVPPEVREVNVRFIAGAGIAPAANTP